MEKRERFCRQIARLFGSTDGAIYSTRISAGVVDPLLFQAASDLGEQRPTAAADKRTWWTEIATAGEAAELGWLRDACSCTQPKLTPVTWAQRHRG